MVQGLTFGKGRTSIVGALRESDFKESRKNRD